MNVPGLYLGGRILFYSGCALSLASSVVVYNGWRVALNGASYRPATLRVLEVTRGQGRHSHYDHGEGVVDGVKEKVGLSDFGPRSGSQEELEKRYPAGSSLEVWYDPSAADVRTQGSNLRILPRSFRLEDAFGIAVKRTLIWNAPLLLGGMVCLLARPPKKEKKARVSPRPRDPGDPLFSRPALEMELGTDWTDKFPPTHKGVCQAVAEGENILLSQGEETYMQAMREEETDLFVLEYREGSEERHFACTRSLSVEEVETAFLKYLTGETSWKTDVEWEKVDL